MPQAKVISDYHNSKLLPKEAKNTAKNYANISKLEIFIKLLNLTRLWANKQKTQRTKDTLKRSAGHAQRPPAHHQILHTSKY